MKAIYVIGGICNGKSVVCRYLEGKGAVYINLDDLSQEVLERPEVIDKVKSLSEEIEIKDGKIDKEKLSQYLFSNTMTTHKFDKIVFPFIKDALDEKTKNLDDDDFVVVEYTGYYGQPREEDIFLKEANTVIWVESSFKDKLARGEKRGLPPFELTWRMRVQPFDEEYEAVADYVIHNNSTEEALDERVADIWASCC